ncbi:hypothetical protein IEN85_19475 [Pelagicoccus sp. NFK12]|uniref:Anti-sigma-28 factor FlgM C-terminal domain-containing protein n=1 Tax=Pelagicoccus enzymogenes TaxID=2773457 RepID=A0A927FC78_9BACT|nr:hypothetical protein [Pelagicoccus enzymogenes]MBD5781690.1 hypothetical protein [Pelagicoccus enzymogenes]MDQ8200030.1 hypothetical protein [Pelagicoccus enzymogenes]
MNINPQNNASNIYAQNLGKAGQNPQAKAAEESGSKAAAAAGDKLELNALDSLRSQPEVRPEVVAKGKELLNDPNFPSKEMMHDIAKLIVPFADDE